MDLGKAIEERAITARFPDGQNYRSLSLRAVSALAGEHGSTTRAVELRALEFEIVPERYARNLRSFSIDQQHKLLSSRVAVVGLGGLGGFVVELLARAGVGELVLVDGDRFEDHNLNRQLLSSESLLDRPKADVATERVRAINSAVDLTVRGEFITEQNALEVLAGADVVADCLDNLPDRFVLQEAALQMDRPLVSAAVAGYFGHVTTIFPGDDGLTRLYGPRESVPRKGVEMELGCLPYAVASVASAECSEVVALLLTGVGKLRGRVLTLDLERFRMASLRYSGGA